MTNKIRFIGDIHGKYDEYVSLLDCDHPTIQVGDFGMGFRTPPNIDYKKNKFIRGNHDSPEVARNHDGYIPDGTFMFDGKMCLFGGASSIDKAMRIEGVSWWPDEQLNVMEQHRILDDYVMNKPNILITHEAANSVASLLLVEMGKYKVTHDGDHTRSFIDILFGEHRPKLHIFGHWHHSFDEVLCGTRFICLNELEYIDIDLKEYL